MKLTTHAMIHNGRDQVSFHQKPFFNDCCGHGGYIGSVSVKDLESLESNPHKADVYIFEGSFHQEVCIRYGNESSYYISPGTPVDILLSRWTQDRCDLVKAACQLILLKTQAKFEPIPEEEREPNIENDEFKCPECDRIFDIEDSIRITDPDPRFVCTNCHETMKEQS